MKSSPGLLLTVVAAGLALTACGGSSSSPIIRNYQSGSGRPVVTPQSLCIRNPDGGGYICSGKDTEPCSITSQTFASEPTDTARTTIGVGEVVQITTSGESLSYSGDGSLSGGSSPATLTAGDTAGTVTVSTPGRYQVCQANSLTFTVITPTAVLYSRADGNVGHTQGTATVGLLANVYLQPDTVSFQYTQFEEQLENFAADGSWFCFDGTPHNRLSYPIQVGTDVPGYGSELVQMQDEALSGSCTGNQTQVSSESVTYPDLYFVGGASPIGTIMTITQTATEDASGNLTMAKTTETAGSTTVNSPNQSL